MKFKREELQTLVNLWRVLPPRRRRQFWGLFLLMVASGFSEALSLGLLIPFLAAMAAPEKIISHPLIVRIIEFLGFSNEIGEVSMGNPKAIGQLLPLLGLLFVAGILTAGAVRLLVLYASVRLANGVGTDLGTEAYRRTLYQPYSVHTARNSSTMISGLTTKVGLTVSTFSSALAVLTSMVVVVAILTALLAVSPWTTLVAGLALGGCYFLFVAAGRRHLIRNSSRVAREKNQIVKVLQEGLSGIRDILLDGTQETFCGIYRKSDHRLKRASATNAVIAQSPRFIMESFGITIFVALALFLNKQPDGLIAALPVLGALALGVQRLLPALQAGYNSWASILGNQASTQEVVELLCQPLPAHFARAQVSAMPFRQNIRFCDVHFRYSKHGPWVIRGLSFEIPKGSRVGFAGKTGAGKSTCLDLLMGLLEPSAGGIFIDGQRLDENNLNAWQKNIAHVPQAIFLADGSLAENIAFGVAPEKIDMAKVRQAAGRAQLAEFIESCPAQYQSQVGERGIRLSGGQRQRIGIARALYKLAAVLIFDEATNALDLETEETVMDALEALDSSLTLLLISHRPSTLKRCDLVIPLG